MPTPTRRGAPVRIPQWWLDRAREEMMRALIALGRTPSLHTAGVELARAAGRRTPWAHVSVMRFFSGRPTDDLAAAIMVLCPRLPRFAYYPEDEGEARAYESVRLRFTVERRGASRETFLTAAEHVIGVASDGPREVASPHVEQATARRGARREKTVRRERKGDRRMGARRARSRDR